MNSATRWKTNGVFDLFVVGLPPLQKAGLLPRSPISNQQPSHTESLSSAMSTYTLSGTHIFSCFFVGQASRGEGKTTYSLVSLFVKLQEERGKRKKERFHFQIHRTPNQSPTNPPTPRSHLTPLLPVAI
jgi:hypothetical protein